MRWLEWTFGHHVFYINCLDYVCATQRDGILFVENLIRIKFELAHWFLKFAILFHELLIPLDLLGDISPSFNWCILIYLEWFLITQAEIVAQTVILDQKSHRLLSSSSLYFVSSFHLFELRNLFVSIRWVDIRWFEPLIICQTHLIVIMHFQKLATRSYQIALFAFWTVNLIVSGIIVI